MAQQLPVPRKEADNIRIYDHNEALLASMQINPRDTFLTREMLYRYLSWIFVVPSDAEWALFSRRRDGAPCSRLVHDSQSPVRPGNYLALNRSGDPLEINLTAAEAPRRVTTQDQSTRSQGHTDRDNLQDEFRQGLRTRDRVCAITGTGPRISIPERPFAGLEASQALYSLQNGLLLGLDIHEAFDAYSVGIDVDAEYKIIIFGGNPGGLSGTQLADSARLGTTVVNGGHAVSPELLRWHLMMCVYRHMKANTKPERAWDEVPAGVDNMGRILAQPDAAERMETELFTRLGPVMA